MDAKMLDELNELFLFQLLNKEEIKEIADAFCAKTYGEGTKIFSENDRGDALYIVKTGSVKITKKDDAGEKEIITLLPGDFFGEIALFECVDRTATVRAAQESCILEIHREKFDIIFSQKPHIAAKILYQMMFEMSRRLRRANSPKNYLVF